MANNYTSEGHLGYRIGQSEPTNMEQNPVVLRGEVDRRFLFEYGLNYLSYFMFQFELSGLINQLSIEEVKVFEQLKSIAESQNKFVEIRNVSFEFREQKNFPFEFLMYFSRNQKRFMLNPGEPVRTGVNYEGNHSNFFINLNIINDTKTRITLDQAVQIVIHEIGHKIPNKIQADVDRIATLVARFIKSKTKTTRLSDGSLIHFLSGLKFQNYELKDYHLMKRSFVVWRESVNSIQDLTTEIQNTFFRELSQLTPREHEAIYMERLYDFPNSHNLQFYFKHLNIEDIDELAQNKLRIRYEMNEKINRISRDSFSASQFQFLPKPISDTQKNGSVLLSWKNQFSEISKILFEKEYKTLTDVVAEVVDLKESDREIRLIVKLPKEIAETLKTIDLVLQISKENIILRGKRSAEILDHFEFIGRWSEQTRANFVQFDSFIINESQMIYADQGFHINLKNNYQQSQRLKLNQLMIETPVGPVVITKRPLLEKMDFKIYFVFESNSPILQIGVSWKRILNTIDPGENHYNLSDHEIRDKTIWSSGNTKYFWQKTEVDVEYYDQSQFTQKRVGNRIHVELTIPHKQRIVTDSLVKITNKISRFYTHIRHAGKVLAVEQFTKQLMHLDVVSESFEKISVVPEKEWMIEFNKSAKEIMGSLSAWNNLSMDDKSQKISSFEREKRNQEIIRRLKNVDTSILKGATPFDNEQKSVKLRKSCQSIFKQ